VRRAKRVSLLDDPWFLDELDRIDLPMCSPAVEADAPMDGDRTDENPPQIWFTPDVAPERGDGSAGRILLSLAGFLLMMGLGAASAALVFSDRVAALLSR
jgi:hypothetical protein